MIGIILAFLVIMIILILIGIIKHAFSFALKSALLILALLFLCSIFLWGDMKAHHLKTNQYIIQIQNSENASLTQEYYILDVAIPLEAANLTIADKKRILTIKIKGDYHEKQLAEINKTLFKKKWAAAKFSYIEFFGDDRIENVTFIPETYSTTVFELFVP